MSETEAPTRRSENSRQRIKRLAEEGYAGNNPAEQRRNAAKGKHRQFYEGETRRKEVLELVAGGMLVKEAVRQVGVTYGTYERWRSRYKSWAARVDVARQGTHVPNDDKPPSKLTALDVAELREYYFGHKTPDFQMEVLTARREIPPGNILLVLFPPEHGKTTIYEDDKCIEIAHDPSSLNHVASETQHLSKKILSRIRGRLDPSGKNHRMLEFVNRYGPFAPQKGDGRSSQQPWASTHFDVWGKSEFDDRDYTLAALGFGSQIIGSRSDHLHCDDLQSMRTLNKTEKMLDDFRQDWLSRPGETGFTSIFGNRVDEGDIYGAIEDAFPPDILHVIRYPAIRVNRETGQPEPLWPERWSMEKLRRMRVKVGEARWERNWMQEPRKKGTLSFTEEMVDSVKNPALSLTKPIPDDGKICYLSLDPAIGGRTAIMVIQVTHAGRMRPIYLRDIPGLSSNEEIMAHCASAIIWAEAHGFVITDWMIEAKNFQAGLARDERLLELARVHGISTREHLTGWNKYDENIGVASMVTTFVKEEIELPWADDDETRFAIGGLRTQLLAWRPAKGGGGTASAMGNKLRQDLVMALWFAWIKWRQVGKRQTDESTSSQFKHTGLPYTPTSTAGGLIVMTKYTPLGYQKVG